MPRDTAYDAFVSFTGEVEDQLFAFSTLDRPDFVSHSVVVRALRRAHTRLREPCGMW